ncbi:MAG: copper chaperone PCu(A)C [Gammaproteobacteria bacterium]|nr:copper chaperone PCu(A)C [Gammaproteobacteria bacterium]
MKNTIRTSALILKSIFFCLTILFSAHAQASDPLNISHSFSPEAPPVAKVLAAYMTLSNPGNTEVVITGASSADFDKVEIHSMEMSDGMMHMVEQKELRIPAKGELTLEPGELHMMLINKHRNLKDGDRIKINIQFNNGQSQSIVVPVSKQH